jgi:hypothetical protein
MQPRADVFRKFMAAKRPAGLLRPRWQGSKANEQSAAQHLEKIAAIEIRLAPMR